jgi:hypothetical protein
MTLCAAPIAASVSSSFGRRQGQRGSRGAQPRECGRVVAPPVSARRRRVGRVLLAPAVCAEVRPVRRRAVALRTAAARGANCGFPRERGVPDGARVRVEGHCWWKALVIVGFGEAEVQRVAE